MNTTIETRAHVVCHGVVVCACEGHLLITSHGVQHNVTDLLSTEKASILFETAEREAKALFETQEDLKPKLAQVSCSGGRRVACDPVMWRVACGGGGVACGVWRTRLARTGTGGLAPPPGPTPPSAPRHTAQQMLAPAHN